MKSVFFINKKNNQNKQKSLGFILKFNILIEKRKERLNN